MIKKGYRLVSTEEIKPFANFDKNNFGGKQMWEERLSNLDILINKLFRILIIISVLAYVIFTISFISGLILKLSVVLFSIDVPPCTNVVT